MSVSQMESGTLSIRHLGLMEMAIYAIVVAISIRVVLLSQKTGVVCRIRFAFRQFYYWLISTATVGKSTLEKQEEHSRQEGMNTRQQ